VKGRGEGREGGEEWEGSEGREELGDGRERGWESGKGELELGSKCGKRKLQELK
jgi:hypothetical protein